MGILEGRTVAAAEHTPTLDDLTREAIASGFEPAVVGRHILMLAAHPNGIERAIAYSAIVVKARMARRAREAR